MSRPPINPDKTVAGIAVDPRTLERVIPESKRPDGTVRKQIKIRPGFTPQEDVRRFRGTRQAQMDANTLPKGHIIGWAPPPQSTAASGFAKPMSKSAKKNAKRREKKAEQTSVPDNWEDDDEEDRDAKAVDGDGKKSGETAQTKTEPSPASATQSNEAPSDVEGLTSKLGKLGVK
ncbi:hypothetical protein D9615_000350 [Tricholomella constricta]|uniref:WIBG Mago-binding domain-containing protein n=1 Tax=Tricholomella constricta TaxID=117010 RepID=A0A8H5MBF7_9AGAR|nr:hypothetical protein D9615_000350 [Tricholomella constricta]